MLAPARTEVDDVLVERWNRVTEVWRNEVEFRTAVLRYATNNAHRDPASSALWPEVVYPLIERARWHRRIRTRTEAVWDYLCGRLACSRRRRGARPGARPGRAGAAGRSAGRLAGPACSTIRGSTMKRPTHSPRGPDEADRLTASLDDSRVSLVELAAEQLGTDKAKGLLPLADPDPIRFTQGQLHELWKEALTVLQSQAQPGRAPSRPATAMSRSARTG